MKSGEFLDLQNRFMLLPVRTVDNMKLSNNLSVDKYQV